MSEIEKLRNNELFMKLFKAAKKGLPNAQIFAGPTGMIDDEFAIIYVLGATDEECERVGQQVLPYYNYEDASNFMLPICIDPTTPFFTEELTEITDMEV